MRLPTMGALGLLVALAAAPAVADPVVVRETTYLREGPSSHYRPVDEVLAGRHVEVLACEAQWCQVRSGDRVGYARETVLVQEKLLATGSGDRTCFKNREAGYGDGRDLDICHVGAR